MLLPFGQRFLVLPCQINTPAVKNYSFLPLQCSVSCGLGSKRRKVTCQALDTEEILDPENCNPAGKPKEKEKCNPGPCTVRWMATDWSEVRLKFSRCIVIVLPFSCLRYERRAALTTYSNAVTQVNNFLVSVWAIKYEISSTKCEARWQDINQVQFLRVLSKRKVEVHKHTQKRTRSLSCYLINVRS